ncbi:hypothetical protein KM043_015856 [Ampulex compressa]|nr:hypothetical protein KM043_015856 [Ampulex compressa]
MHRLLSVSLSVAMAAVRSRTYFILYFIAAISAQYTDDSDYNDLNFYEDLTMGYEENFDKDQSDVLQDDFYILNDFDEAETRRDIYRPKNDLSIAYGNNGNIHKKRNSFSGQMDWYKLPEKVYRYTKHRIAGYDYEELDYMGARSYQECDDKSLWTHCLCQFTCSEPDVVDCYTPCKSGCECKEEYVFDEERQECSLPQHCSSKNEIFHYKK